MSLQIDVEPKSENLQTGAPNLEANFSDYGNELVDFFLKAGILTPKQVQHAQRVSSKIETSKPLTIILKELNFITHDQIIDALQNRPISMPLGNLLVELGHIHQADLQLAKDIQTSENSKRDFDKILIDQGLIDEKTLMQTRALKLGIP
jgi:type IV pilus assembly protein PilB